MSDIAENIQESIEQTGKSKINSRVALFVAITATFMALCNVKDGNICSTGWCPHQPESYYQVQFKSP